jgi:hypothetical protein
MSEPVELIALDGSLRPLIAHFNAAAGRIRLLALVSPT